MEPTHVDGAHRGHVLLFALSTCAWCKKTKRLMNELGVDYYYIDVDLLDGDEKERVQDELRQWNPRCSFPTIVIDDDKALISYDEDEIRKALGNE
jgi:glutaredoxin-like protein NrdH